jgi:hypothetical protein
MSLLTGNEKRWKALRPSFNLCEPGRCSAGLEGAEWSAISKDEKSAEKALFVVGGVLTPFSGHHEFHAEELYLLRGLPAARLVLA